MTSDEIIVLHNEFRAPFPDGHPLESVIWRRVAEDFVMLLLRYGKDSPVTAEQLKKRFVGTRLQIEDGMPCDAYHIAWDIVDRVSWELLANECQKRLRNAQTASP